MVKENGRPFNPKVESDHYIHQAVTVGDIETVSEFLDNGGSPNILDSYDCEPLYTAVKYGKIGIARLLLRAGGDISRKSKFRGTAFGAACWNWNLKMIDFCLEAGTDINSLENGYTILDDLMSQKSHIATESLSEWEAAYNKLVKFGALHANKL